MTAPVDRRRTPRSTTATLTLLSVGSVLLALVACLGVVCWLVLWAPSETVGPALDAVGGLGGAALLALGGAGAMGTTIYGARHVPTSQRAPTTAELLRDEP